MGLRGTRLGRLGALVPMVVVMAALVGAAAASLPAPRFGAPQPYPEHGANDPAGIALADMNGDGRNDLVTVNSGDEVTIRHGLQTGGFGAPHPFPVGADRNYYGLAVTRLNGDSRPDIATTNETDGTITTLLSGPHGTFTNSTFRPAPAGSPVFPSDVAAADLNRDGNQDLAVTDADSGSIWILLGKGNGKFRPPRTAAANVSGSVQIVAGRFNAGRLPDLAVVTSDTNADVLLNRGHGRFHALPALDFGPNTNTYGIAAGRFNHDKLSDLAITVEDFNTMPSPDYVAALTATGGGQFHERDINDGEAVNVIGVGIGDLNGDGVSDIVTARFDGNDLTILAGKGGGLFAAPVAIPGLSVPATLALGQVDANDSTDLAVSGDHTVSILQNKRSR